MIRANAKIDLNMKLILKILLCFSIIFILASCQEKHPEDTRVPGGLTGLNHTKVAIISFYVDGQWGGNIRAMGGGGKTVCCVSMPREYPKEGIKVKVRWNATDTLEEHWFEKEVNVDPYSSKGGDVYVHFLPNQQVRVVVSNIHPMSPEYPGPGMPGEEKNK
ncbi:MAG: DUF3304 domain-containing protein [Iodobacter sp.]